MGCGGVLVSIDGEVRGVVVDFGGEGTCVSAVF